MAEETETPVEETPLQKNIREAKDRKERDEEVFSKPAGQIDEKYDPINLAIAEFLDISPDDWDTYKDKIEVIREWAEVTSRSKDRVEILSVLKYLQDKVAQPTYGENRVKNLYKWIRLDQDSARIQKEKELYENR